VGVIAVNVIGGVVCGVINDVAIVVDTVYIVIDVDDVSCVGCSDVVGVGGSVSDDVVVVVVVIVVTVYVVVVVVVVVIVV